MEARPATGLWVAWALALAGGIAVVIAAILVTRTDLEAVCRAGLPCAGGLPPTVVLLAFGGTGVAVVGGLTATVLAVRRLADRGDGHAGNDRATTGTSAERS